MALLLHNPKNQEGCIRTMDFEILLRRAQMGDQEAKEEIFRMYRPLIIKNSMERTVLTKIYIRNYQLLY